jgi:hypothetical protein
MTKIYIDEIPPEESTDGYIMRVTNSREKWQRIKNEITVNKLEFLIKDYQHSLLEKDTIAALTELKFRGWVRKDGGGLESNSKYGGLSFVYNPNHIDNVDPENSTLGTPRNEMSEFYDYNTKNTPLLKNSYLDTYAFTEKTELSNYGYIKDFLGDRCQRTLIRSRLGVIKGGFPDARFDKLSWHRDEAIYINLRLNIPITTEPGYIFQMNEEDPYHLDVGKAYTWNTSIPHRAFQKGITTEDRVHFVLGFSPWFDFDKENRCWVKNDFWGKHPFQMMLDGDIFKGLESIN